MSIRRIQTENIMKTAILALYSAGVEPTEQQVLEIVSKYFAKFPPGLPLPVPYQNVRPHTRADVSNLNELFAHTGINLDVLYESCLDDVERIMSMHSAFNSDVHRLRARRNALRARVDDYLLSQYNSDGYFFSASDSFWNLNNTSMELTTAYVDTDVGAVTLSPLSGRTRRVPPQDISAVNLSVRRKDKEIPFRELSPFVGCLRSYSNTFWAIEVATEKEEEVVVVVTANLGTQGGQAHSVSRVEFTPYGAEPVQCFIETRQRSLSPEIPLKGFGSQIKTSNAKMVFQEEAGMVETISFTLRKKTSDYSVVEDGQTVYKYIFGAKEIGIFEYQYDTEGVYISDMIALPSTFRESDGVIDAVSLTVDEDVPPNTSITYFVAAEDASASEVNFDWKPITPIAATDDLNSNFVVRFNGSMKAVHHIRPEPIGNDLQMIPINHTHNDPAQRNPSPTIIPGADVYRIARLPSQPVLDTMVFEDGVNSTKVYWTAYSPQAIQGLEYWTLRSSFNNQAYGQIDTGNDFFYGGTVGRSGVSVMVETYLHKETAEIISEELIKNGPSAKSWEVRAFLNGDEVAWLPFGTDSSLIPWGFKSGPNHIALLITIPFPTAEVSHPYLGTLSIMGSRRLFDLGNVKLDTWSYVDSFDLTYNTVGTPPYFSIRQGEIVSRRKPSTTCCRISYSSPTGSGPTAVRLRADLKRSMNSPSITPSLNEFRLRFSYGES